MANYTNNSDLRNFLQKHLDEANASYDDNGQSDYDEGFRDAIAMITRELTIEIKCPIYSFTI